MSIKCRSMADGPQNPCRPLAGVTWRRRFPLILRQLAATGRPWPADSHSPRRLPKCIARHGSPEPKNLINRARSPRALRSSGLRVTCPKRLPPQPRLPQLIMDCHPSIEAQISLAFETTVIGSRPSTPSLAKSSRCGTAPAIRCASLCGSDDCAATPQHPATNVPRASWPATGRQKSPFAADQ
jgi:hypothetical protein